MRNKLRLVLIAGGLLACCVAACGDDSQKRLARESGERGTTPDVPGTGGAAGIGIPGGNGGRTGSPPALPPASAGIPTGSVCEPSGWCWYNPQPSGASWRGIGGAGRTDMWIGGSDTPNLLHFDGGQWNVATSALSSTWAIWAASETDVWFVGGTGTAVLNQAIAHWDGSAMSLSAVFGEGQLADV